MILYDVIIFINVSLSSFSEDCLVGMGFSGSFQHLLFYNGSKRDSWDWETLDNRFVCECNCVARTADNMLSIQKPWTFASQVSLLPSGFRRKSYQKSIPFSAFIVVLGWLQYEGLPLHPIYPISLSTKFVNISR